MVSATTTTEQLEAAHLIADAQLCVALTGAGLSTPSGIPDFRSPGGLWTQVSPLEVAHIDVWRNDPVRFWDFYRQRLDIPADFAPNDAHAALTELQRRGLLTAIITQNIDGLQQKSGADDVLELHGNVRTLSCPCGTRRERAGVLFAPDGVPYCPACAARGVKQALKPDVVLFGELLDEDALSFAYSLAWTCDLLLAVGSSLSVYPAAQLPFCAAAGGAKVVVISHESRYDEYADLRLTGDVAVELSGVMSALDGLAR